MIERRLITDRAEWLEWRKQDITASTVGALFGCHPYISGLRVYAEKRGTEFEPLDDNKILRRGRWLEPAIAKAVAELEPSWSITPSNEYYRDPALRLGATPDFLLLDNQDRRGIMQAKTVAPHIYERDWQGGKEPPLWVLLQAATEIGLTEAQFAVVAAMVVDPYQMDVVLHRFERTAAVEEKIVRQVSEFWRMVEAGQEPAPDYGRDRDVIRALHPVAEPDKVIDLRDRNDLPGLLADRVRMKAENALNEEAIKKIETELIHRIGDAERALIEGFSVSYKVVDVAGYTVKPRSSRQLRVLDRRQP